MSRYILCFGCTIPELTLGVGATISLC